jgi:hypothetical protein
MINRMIDFYHRQPEGCGQSREVAVHVRRIGSGAPVESQIRLEAIAFD